MELRKLYRKERISRTKVVKKGDRIRKYYYEGVVIGVSKPHPTKLKVRIDKVHTGDQQLIGLVWVCDNDPKVTVLKGTTDGESR